MADDKIEVEIVLDNDTTKKGFKKFNKQAKKSAKKAGDDYDVFVNKRFGAGIFQLKSQMLVLGAAIGAAFLAFRGASVVIKAAQEQEDAINQLNSALRITGKFTEQASKDFQNFASELQKSTRFGDEVILKNAAVLQSLGNLSTQGLKQATKAAVDMSAALGTDLNASMVLLGKAAVGEIGSLSRYGVIVKRGKDNAETFSRTLDELNSKFGGAAAAQVDTFSGSFDQLSNNFGDLLEGIGDLIIKSPLAQDLIESLSAIVGKLADDLKESNVKDFGSGLEKANIALTESAANVGRLRSQLKGLQSDEFLNPTAITAAKDELFKAEMALAAVEKRVVRMQRAAEPGKEAAEIFPLPDLGKFEAKLNALTFARISAEETALKAGGVTAEERNRLLELNSEKAVAMAQQTEMQIQKIRDTFTAQLGFTQEQRNELILEKQMELASKMRLVAIQQGELLQSDTENFAKGFNDALTSMAGTTKKLGAQMAGTIKGGMVSAFSSLGAALAKGQSGFDAFGKALLSMLGQLAIQYGTFLVLTGLGFSLIPGGQAAAGSVPLGLALIVLGGALSAIGGGGGASADTGAPGLAEDNTDAPTSQFDEEELEESQSIAINIQGDVFDSEETGTRLAQIINESFDTSGTLINAEAIS